MALQREARQVAAAEAAAASHAAATPTPFKHASELARQVTQAGGTSTSAAAAAAAAAAFVFQCCLLVLVRCLLRQLPHPCIFPNSCTPTPSLSPSDLLIFHHCATPKVVLPPLILCTTRLSAQAPLPVPCRNLPKTGVHTPQTRRHKDRHTQVHTCERLMHPRTHAHTHVHTHARAHAGQQREPQRGAQRGGRQWRRRAPLLAQLPSPPSRCRAGETRRLGALCCMGGPCGPLPHVLDWRCPGEASVWGTLCGALCVGHSVWGTLCEALCVGHSVWSTLCGAHQRRARNVRKRPRG